MGLRAKLIVGLADEEIGGRVANVIQHTTGTSSALTVGATTTRVGLSGGTVGFFGGAGSAQATSAAVTDYASLKVALQDYGLIGS